MGVCDVANSHRIALTGILLTAEAGADRELDNLWASARRLNGSLMCFAQAAGAMQVNKITERIIGCAIEVHRELGPGLLESAYEPCLEWELQRDGLHVRRQLILPVIYKGIELKSDYRIDLLVEEQVVVEVKAVNKIEPVMHAQVITYLKLSGCKVGLLINFKVRWLKTGIERIVHNYTPEDTHTGV